MVAKFVIVLALAVAASAVPLVPVAKIAYAEPEAPAHYEFQYSVHDEHNGDVKQQQESRAGDAVHGSYSLVQPDGVHRIVEYTADKVNGFNANVRYEGTPIPAPAPAKIAYAAPAKIAYAAPVAKVAYSAPIAYAAPVTKVAYSTPVSYAAPVTKIGYSAPVSYAAPVAKVAYAAPLAQEIFIKEYLKHYHSNHSDKDVEPSIDDVNQLLSEVDAFALASHLFWSLWSVVNASKSQIPFGYWEYALSRLETYLRLKQEVVKKDKYGFPQKRKICEVDI